MMTTTTITDNHVQAGQFSGCVRTLLVASPAEEKKQSIEEACAECNAIPLDTFIDELKACIEKSPDHASCVCFGKSHERHIPPRIVFKR